MKQYEDTYLARLLCGALTTITLHPHASPACFTRTTVYPRPHSRIIARGGGGGRAEGGCEGGLVTMTPPPPSVTHPSGVADGSQAAEVCVRWLLCA
jgi:hypothetical protein